MQLGLDEKQLPKQNGEPWSRSYENRCFFLCVCFSCCAAHFFFQRKISSTPPKFNIAPEKWWLEDYFPFGKAYFQGPC